jgi:hypothetical protein
MHIPTNISQLFSTIFENTPQYIIINYLNIPTLITDFIKQCNIQVQL